jgi:tetrahydromethanopterin S-methyltransferase subunit A
MSTTQTIDYGKDEATRIIDNNGSTETVVKTFRAGVPKVRRRVEIRHRTDVTNIDKITEIVNSLLNDPTKLDTGIRFEPVMGDKGYHHIVECYTLLEF